VLGVCCAPTERPADAFEQARLILARARRLGEPFEVVWPKAVDAAAPVMLSSLMCGLAMLMQSLRLATATPTLRSPTAAPSATRSRSESLHASVRLASIRSPATR
jgi:hypothetical protein